MGRAEAAVALLRSLGAAELDHPGGTLLAHLERVQLLLTAWGARPDLRLAGLCHACYGTDGFATTLLPLNARGRLSEVIGPAAEQLVYDYGSCDRALSYRQLPVADGLIRDRFSGLESVPDQRRRQDFAELTVANELDVLRHSAELRERWGPALGRLFTSLDPLLSEPARRAVRDALG
ncbi:DUF6817 domain-containing protein [Kitasatospora sp. GAS204B]|uniref:DUF6817 domain-containing protein n=1 Tax=unclassified Kitasatospora TaxID=2633591 RepID=UPI0024747110|nr:hypothetical protein [Kitasatospora sp. GAS204B]MDH6118409.1 hypothetical protein [Kitasatospora sp. GAS204B]